MLVFVLNKHGEPLMPCSNRKARLLLKEGKAEIHSYKPFTIQLKFGSSGYVQDDVEIGVDTGFTNVGIAVTTETKIFHANEIKFRNDVSELLTTRKSYRKGRRYRKTRYRPKSFARSSKRIFCMKQKRWIKVKIKYRGYDDWLSPSYLAKEANLINWVEKYKKRVPCSKLILEVGHFDVAKIINPEISGKDYQEGSQKGFENVKAYVRHRDEYTCQHCKGKEKDVRLEVHHTIFKSNGGSDKPDNLICLCKTCHDNLHQGVIKPKLKITKSYKEATFMNILASRLREFYPEAELTFGYETKLHRMELGLPKSHANDAIAVTNIKSIPQEKIEVLYVKQCRKKKRSLHEAKPRKGRKEPNTTSSRNAKNTKAVGNICLFDKVSIDNQVGWVSGFTGGNCYVVDFSGKYLSFKNTKGTDSIRINMGRLKVIHRNNNWISEIR